jgi:hypothetical protein
MPGDLIVELGGEAGNGGCLGSGVLDADAPRTPPPAALSCAVVTVSAVTNWAWMVTVLPLTREIAYAAGDCPPWSGPASTAPAAR